MTPHATYRLQFRNGMDFDKAVEIVPYLVQLGISHLYASPIFTAASGSTHGYDVADHNEIDPTLGGRKGFDRLSAALKKAGLGLILDIVPNHMAASLDNGWWRSVIERGEESPFASHFDIDWREPLTLPMLGKSFDEAAAAAELVLKIDREHGNLALAYFDNLLPLHPSSYGLALSALAHPLTRQIMKLVEGRRDADLSAMHDAIQTMLKNGDAVDALDAELSEASANATLLKRIHAAQPWRLGFWKDAPKHLSYRRFFEVTGLVGVRVEDRKVFDDVHRLVLTLVRDGQVDGLRIDHVDGLADPGAYLERLRSEIGPDTYLVVEKILAKDERLPANWPIDGTTGYEFIADIASVLTDADQSKTLTQHYDAVRGEPFDFADEEASAKRDMVERNFETELEALVLLATEAFGADEAALREAIVALIIAFPVYRTYGDASGMPEADLDLLGEVAAKASQNADTQAISSITQLLRGAVPPALAPLATSFRIRFQQLTGPIMAKSIEDTLFFRFNRLIALNEVGGDAETVGGSVAQFHAAMAIRLRDQPTGLIATTTHDTKRGEDARARLYTLSEAPDVWAAGVERWRAMQVSCVARLADGAAPAPDTEWMLYQALAGIWPAGGGSDTDLDDLASRFSGFVEKALREDKRRTRWTEIDEEYEATVQAYAARLVSKSNQAFAKDFSDTLAPFAMAGAINGLTQTLLKLTVPGIPDIYQGSETVDDSLVDPDNRRAIDFDNLRHTLQDMPADILSWDKIIDGSAAQQLIAQVLAYRKTRNDLFTHGSYEPLGVSGAASKHVVAFARSLGGEFAITVAPRLPLSLLKDSQPGAIDWRDSTISLPDEIRNVALTDLFSGQKFVAGEELNLSQALRSQPVALLARVR